jgi:hypothetical protein
VKKVIKVILLVWLALGALGVTAVLLSSALSGLGVRLVSSTIRFPLSGVSSLGVDDKGHIIVYTTDLARLQVFDAEGGFCKGWYVPNSSPNPGTSELSINEHQQIQLTLLNDNYYVFDMDGNILEHSKRKGIWDQIHNKYIAPPACTDYNGNRYTFRESLFSPRIIKVTPQGKATSIINEPLYTLPCRGKYTVVCFFGPPVVILAAWGLWVQRRKQSSTVGTAA